MHRSAPTYRDIDAAELAARLGTADEPYVVDVREPDEVAEWEWATPEHVRAAVEATPFAFSPWLVLQLSEWTAFGR